MEFEGVEKSLIMELLVKEVMLLSDKEEYYRQYLLNLDINVDGEKADIIYGILKSIADRKKQFQEILYKIESN